MNQREVRVRFAPSPTGPLHIGGVRTALYNYLFAKKHGGKMILRIEDTDQTRFVEGAEDYIVKSLEWCGIEFDESVNKGGEFGPYRQSERKDTYKKYAEQLVADGWAYYAFDTAEDLDQLRKEYESDKKTFVYNGETRKTLHNSIALAAEEVERLKNEGHAFVIRFKTPEDEILMMNDIIRGEVKVNTSTLDDKILFKSDGMPTYHLANIVDDHMMNISHVIRGEEWLPSLPLHTMLYTAFGWEAPEFAHLPLLLKPDGPGKLSKRDGDRLGFPVFPMEWKDPKTGDISSGYRESGYFHDAFINMLAFLGWNPGTEQEIFSMEELIDTFSLERVGKSGSRFDPDKAKWFNHQYMQKKAVEEIAVEFDLVLKAKGIEISLDIVKRVVEMVRERANFVKDIWEQSAFFFEAPTEFDAKFVKKRWKENSPELLKGVREIITNIDDFSAAIIKPQLEVYVEQQGCGFGPIMNIFRLALVGAGKGPDLFEIAEIIGKEQVLSRIDYALENIKK
ncbi:MAG: glutamate--tRNA ligase [Hyphomicrobiales bacterium]